MKKPEYYTIRGTKLSDLDDWLELAYKLWPEHDREGIRTELLEILKSRIEIGLIGRDHHGKAIAFANISLRVDYVQGSQRSPVGYLEGIFVEKPYRKSGIARALVKIAEKWSRGKGATEFGSDTDATNRVSQRFHRAVGFQDAGRIMHYIKQLD